MKTMTRRARALLAAVASFAAVLLMSAGAASAASYAPSTGSSSGAGSLNVGTHQPTVGGSLAVSGTNCNPNSTVSISLDNGRFPLGTAPTDASGRYSTTVTLPSGLTGTHTVTVVGAACAATEGITIQAASSGGGGGGGALAGTGVAVVGIAALGVVLLIGGGLMLLAGRRRRAQHI